MLKRLHNLSFIVALLVFAGLCQAESSQHGSSNGSTSITASEPTHYYYTPTANVGPTNSLVLSLHEISYTFPDNLEVQMSILDNIGRICLGAKYAFHDNMSLGVGLANSIAHVGDGGHGIKVGDRSRLGLFFTYGFLKNSMYEAAVTPHLQLFTHNSIGCDLGGMITPSRIWSVIWEVGTSLDMNSPATVYFNTDGGLRIHPPSIPFMNFDLGIDVAEFPVVKDASTVATIYFDVIFAMIAK